MKLQFKGTTLELRVNSNDEVSNQTAFPSVLPQQATSTRSGGKRHDILDRIRLLMHKILPESSDSRLGTQRNLLAWLFFDKFSLPLYD